MRRLLLTGSILTLTLGLGFGFVLLSDRASAERDVYGMPRGLDADGSRLALASLEEGQALVLEVCAEDGFASGWIDAARFEVLFVEPGADDDLVTRVPFDQMLAGRVLRDPDGTGCVVVASANALGVTGDYALDLRWASPPPPGDILVRGRAMAWSPLAPLDRTSVWLTLLGALLLVVGLSWPATRRAVPRWALEESETPTAAIATPAASSDSDPLTANTVALRSADSAPVVADADTASASAPASDSDSDPDAVALPVPPANTNTDAVAARPPSTETGAAPLTRVALGIGGVVAFMFALAFVPLGGAPGGLARGLGIAVVELLLAWRLILPRQASTPEVSTPTEQDRRKALALVLPSATKLGRLLGSVGLLTAPLLGVALFFVGRIVASLVPTTGRAPIELFVELPSGRLAVALVAVVVPVAEEIFFRGFVYGAVERAKGANVATALTVIAFALVHLPQQWGAWGAFASVTLTGLVLTLLRRFTGSTLLPALAHLGHNGLITLVSL